VSIEGRFRPNDIGFTRVVQGINAKSEDWPWHFMTSAVNVSWIDNRGEAFFAELLTTFIDSFLRSFFPDSLLPSQQLLAIGVSIFFEKHAGDLEATTGAVSVTIA